MTKIFLILILIFSGTISASTLDVVGATENQLKNISIAIEQFHTDCGSYPEASSWKSSLTQESRECWKGPYIRQAQLIDHWHNYIDYSIRGDYFDLKSYGADRIYGTEDDISLRDSTKQWRVIYSDKKNESDDRPENFGKYLIVLMTILIFISYFFFERKKK